MTTLREQAIDLVKTRGVIHDGERLYHTIRCPARDPAINPDQCQCGGLSDPLYRGVPMCERWYQDDTRPWDTPHG
jgi:hypothetical protein